MNAPHVPPQPSSVARWVYRSVGVLFFTLGVIGILLPVLPTVPFWLVSLWAFGRSNPAWRDAMLNHPRYGASLRRWDEHGMIAHRHKFIAIGSMIASFALTSYLLWGVWWLKALLSVGLIALIVWIWRRPEPPDDRVALIAGPDTVIGAPEA